MVSGLMPRPLQQIAEFDMRKKQAPRFHVSPLCFLCPRKTRSNSLEAGESQGLEPHGRSSGNPDNPSDDRGRVGRESSPTMEHGSPADLSSAVRDPNMKVEPTVPSGSEETRQLNPQQGFDLEQVEGRGNDHGAPEKGTIDSDSDGLALRPGEYGEDTSSVALQSHVGDETAGAHAGKVTDSPDIPPTVFAHLSSVF